MGRPHSKSTPPDQGAHTRAAQYVRMSTDHQRYSTENQREAIEKYAADRHIQIVRTYADEGKSGLRLDGRDALQRLIKDVQAKTIDFTLLLVYDISRWGRFQDADESAYYEYLLRRAGIHVEYCAEPFANDGSPSAVIIKNVKRLMAGEYSRELSNKVFAGQCRLIELGFRQGGPAGFGLRRQLIDCDKRPKAVLTTGERKSLQTDRVILIKGPREETATIMRIYRRFVADRQSEAEIAAELNRAGILTDRAQPWTRGTVHQILTNEKYIGNNVFNRTSFKLKQRHIRNPPDRWIRAQGVFDGIVPTDLFYEAQRIIAERSHRLDDETMLTLLRDLYQRNGVLSGLIIDEQEGMPSSGSYGSQFGGLLRAYALVGYTPERDFHYLQVNEHLRQRHPHFVQEIRGGFEAVGACVVTGPDDLLLVNDEFCVSVVLARCQQTPAGAYRWRLRFDTGLRPDLTIAVRMSVDHERPLDYYLFPNIDAPLHAVKVTEQGNELSLDAYRFETLDALYALAERVPIDVAA